MSETEYPPEPKAHFQRKVVDTQPVKPEWFAEFVDDEMKGEWTFASTMKWAPHWYVIRGRHVKPSRFDRMGAFVYKNGRRGRWRIPMSGKLAGENRYYDHGEYRYWLMPHPSEGVPTVMNREKIQGSEVEFLLPPTLDVLEALVKRWKRKGTRIKDAREQLGDYVAELRAEEQNGDGNEDDAVEEGDG